MGDQGAEPPQPSEQAADLWGPTCTEEHVCPSPATCGETLKHPSSPQFIPALRLAPVDWAECEMKLGERLGAMCWGRFEAGPELLIKKMRIWKMSPGVIYRPDLPGTGQVDLAEKLVVSSDSIHAQKISSSEDVLGCKPGSGPSPGLSPRG